jgi:hypothetical protein
MKGVAMAEKIALSERSSTSAAPTPSASQGRKPQLIAPNLYRVEDDGCVRGFVEEVGPVFVSLVGSRYDHSVEVAQSLSFERAVSLVLGG